MIDRQKEKIFKVKENRNDQTLSNNHDLIINHLIYLKIPKGFLKTNQE